MADYAQHVSRLAPQLYLPLDDVEPSGSARQLGSLSGVTATYMPTVKRTHGPVDGPGIGRGGAMSYTVNAPFSGESGHGVETTTFDNTGTSTTGWSVAWWQKVTNRNRFGSGMIWIGDSTYTAPTSTCWLFNPYTDGSTFWLGAAGANIRQSYAYTGPYGYWSHWVFSWSPSVQTLYRNGQIFWTQAVAKITTGHVATRLRAFSDLTCGLAHVAYWNRTLLPNEARLMHRLRST